MGIAFDSDRYYQHQYQKFTEKVVVGKSGALIEFGGKPFGDHHAARVLPGYDPDLKANLLTEISQWARPVMVVNARDILFPVSGRMPKGRIRGDSGLRYDQDALRIIRESHERNIPLADAVVAVLPSNPSQEDEDRIGGFQRQLQHEGVRLYTQAEIVGYPDNVESDALCAHFERNVPIADPAESLVIISPGGGSGKFSTCLSELYHQLAGGHKPQYIKFETFPVFTLKPTHPLNKAFMAATADLGNEVKEIELTSGQRVTGYDKDIQNFNLLRKLYRHFSVTEYAHLGEDPRDFSVNVLEEGIIDHDTVLTACRDEVIRRLARYTQEMRNGLTWPITVTRTTEILETMKDSLPASPPLNSLTS